MSHANSDLSDLARQTVAVVDGLMTEIRPRLLDGAFAGHLAEQDNDRHEDNFLSAHDTWLHEQYQRRVAEFLPSFIYASEEDDPQVAGPDPDPDLCVLVDPLDTSELAVRGLLGYTHVLIYSRSLQRPVVAVIGDIYHHTRFYVAARAEDGTDVAYALTADGTSYRLQAKPPKPLSAAVVTNFLMKPGERLIPLSEQRRLIAELDKPGADGKHRGRIGVDFGSVSLCHVAAGLTDAVLEFAKGFAIWDLAPGHYVLAAAGGTVIDLHGAPLGLNYGLDSLDDITKAMEPRQKFIAAGSHRLAAEILRALDV